MALELVKLVKGSSAVAQVGGLGFFKLGVGYLPLSQLIDRSIESVSAEDLEGIEIIGTSAFSGCIKLTTATIPNSVTKIGTSAFSNCSSLQNITIPNSVTSIEMSAFNQCSSLQNITIPNSVKTISYGAFSGCTNLNTMKLLPTTPPTIQSDNSGIPTTIARIEVPANSLTTYQTQSYWENFADKMVGV